MPVLELVLVLLPTPAPPTQAMLHVGSLTVPSPNRLFEDPNESSPGLETPPASSTLPGGRAGREPAAEQVVVYTDGACSGNPGPGGWAWVVPDGPFAAGFDTRTTNQRMELTATMEAIRAFEGPLLIVSDSTYVVHCFRDGWWKKWIRKGWVNSKREPVANRDIWEPLIEAVRSRGNVDFRWVKGHSGDRWNDEADRLAVDAGVRQVEISG